jgi:preprotein translocase subunit SecG
MMTFIIAIHVISCILLIGLVLIQRGRGGGLVESFSGVESMFGTKTSAFLTRTTTILSIVFFITCLSLAVLSIRQSKSLMTNIKAQEQTSTKTEAPVTSTQTQATETQTTQAPQTPEAQAKQATGAEQATSQK